MFALLFAAAAVAQLPLHTRLQALAAEAKGKVYVACALPGSSLDCDLEPHVHPPMQSTFKLPLALAVLHQIELGKLQLDQPVRFLRGSSTRTTPSRPR
jgi:beta-lactamase class A